MKTPTRVDILARGFDLCESEAGLAPSFARTVMESPARWHIYEVMELAEEFGVDLADPQSQQRILAIAERNKAREDQVAVPKPRDAAHDPLVYYMRLGDLVKIGTTTNVTRRAETLNPQGFLAVEFGSFDVEAARHRELRADHVHGEWFALTPAVAHRAVVAREAFEAQAGITVEAWLAARLPQQRRRSFSG